MKKSEYNKKCGLSKQEWELDNLADEIIASNSSLERIGILRKYMEFSKELSIKFVDFYRIYTNTQIKWNMGDVYDKFIISLNK